MKLTGAEQFCCSIGELMDLKFANEDFVIDKILPRHGRALLFGDTGAAKTQLALTAAINVIRGEDFLDKYATAKGKVVYIAVGDMPASEFKMKANRLREELDNEEKELIRTVYFPDGIDILEELADEDSWLKQQIKDFNPIFVVVDVISQTHFGDENGPGVAGPTYNAWRQICACDAAPGILFVHHEKKPPMDMEGYNRKFAFSGHLQWVNLVSTAMCIIKEKKEIRTLKIVKYRNMAQPVDIKLELDDTTLLCYPLSHRPVKVWAERQMRKGTPKEEIIAYVQDKSKWRDAASRSSAYDWTKDYEE